MDGVENILVGILSIVGPNVLLNAGFDSFSVTRVGKVAVKPTGFLVEASIRLSVDTLPGV